MDKAVGGMIMKKKSLIILGLTVVMSLALPILSYADYWEKQSDGSYKSWGKDKNLDEDSGFYNINYYKWEQQADGTWKVYHTQDYWKTLCSCAFGHQSDPKLTCPGRLEHKEGWLTKAERYINGNSYLFDENGIMQANRWISEPEYSRMVKTVARAQESEPYYEATYYYYDENGAKVIDGIQDGRVIKDGVWFDPSVIPFREDGRIDISKLDWGRKRLFAMDKRIREEYTPDEILDEFRKIPNFDSPDFNMEVYINSYPDLKKDVEELRNSGVVPEDAIVKFIRFHWENHNPYGWRTPEQYEEYLKSNPWSL